jgi:hypothetical protein
VEKTPNIASSHNLLAASSKSSRNRISIKGPYTVSRSLISNLSQIALNLAHGAVPLRFIFSGYSARIVVSKSIAAALSLVTVLVMIWKVSGMSQGQ